MSAVAAGERDAGWLEAQYRVVAALAQATSLAEAAPHVLEAVAPALGWDVGAAWEPEPGGGGLRCVATWRAPGADPGGAFTRATRDRTFAPGEGLPGRAWRDGEPLWISDVLHEPNFLRREAAEAAGLRAMLAVPVLGGAEALGAIELLARRPREPDHALLRALTTLGRQVGQFVERRRLEDRLRYQNSLLEAQGEAAIDGIAVVTADGRMVWHNRRFLELWGFAPEDATGDDAALLARAARLVADPQAFLDRVRHLYEHLEERARDELRLADGRVLDRYAVPIVVAPGAPPARAWFFRDVTAERRREEQQRYLAEAGVVLGSGLEQDATLRRIAELAVPQLADWSMVYLREDDGSIRRVAIAHRAGDEHPAAVAAATLATHPDIDPAADAGVPLVMRTGRPQLHTHITPEAMAADASDPAAQAAVLRELGLRSWICVPLTARGETFGALSVVTAESGRRYGRADLRFVEQVAQRAALALDNARLYERQHATAEALQRSLLPERLPAPPGVRLAARYVPGSVGVEVGGDWYDALEPGPSTVALAIGDVAGRGVPAAAAMGQLRTALRAFTLEGHPPERALALLAHFLDGLASAELATALCATLDTRTGALRLASAGHPPPVLVAADGTAALLDVPAAAPLGAGDIAPRPREAVLEPGATLLLYTDGLVERRDESLEAGLARLVAAARGRGGDPETLCDAVLEALVAGRERPDDVALIALRR
jgi:PAS domain S-box-containing protein